jgi:MFS family permease
LSAPAAPRGHGARTTQASVIAAAAVFGLTYGLSAPLIALDLSRRGLGETAIGLNAAMYALGVLAIALLLPALAGRWGPRALLAAGLAIVAVVLPGFPLSPWLLLWFPLRFLMGLGSEAVFVTSESWVNQLSEEASRARSVAIYTASLSAGFALGPTIVSALGSEEKLSYVAGGALSLLAMAIVLRFARAAPPLDEEAKVPGGRLALMRLAPVAMVATALNAALETAGLSFLPLYAIRLGWNESAATLLITTLMVGAIVLQLPIGWLGDRVDRRRLMVGLAALSAAGALLWPLLLGHPWIAYPIVFVWGGLFVGIYTLATTIVGSRFSGPELTAIYAVLSLAWGLGALVGPALTGAAMELTRHGLPLFAALACAAFAVYAARNREGV